MGRSDYSHTARIRSATDPDWAARLSIDAERVARSITDEFWKANALADVANWRFLVSGRAYANLLATPSPLLHYWSLSVEEQFYLVLAPLIVAVFALARGRRRPLFAVLALLRRSRSSTAGSS